MRATTYWLNNLLRNRVIFTIEPSTKLLLKEIIGNLQYCGDQKMDNLKVRYNLKDPKSFDEIKFNPLQSTLVVNFHFIPTLVFPFIKQNPLTFFLSAQKISLTSVKIFIHKILFYPPEQSFNLIKITRNESDTVP